MISILLYGRNDSYGYNLHKRAALSLNCLAEVLADEDDEILFVDWNTPDDHPTFPEAIADTLTDRAKRLLRIIRVRPVVHRRFFDRTHLLALESPARNVGLRRANPANRWVLSTNTDIILVPRLDGEDLTAIARELPDRYWAAPRIELPETLWESLDRKNAAGAIRSVAEWGRSFHLNELVRGLDFNVFDGPGDFQLVPRQALVDCQGFNEAMLLGWHVDSNLAKRMMLLFGPPGDLSGRVFAYHCDHTRQITPAHRRDAPQNDSATFIDNVDRAEIPDQAETWGCPDCDIEEIRLTDGSASGYVAALRQVLGSQPLRAPTTVSFVPETFGETGFSAAHVLPFLLDLFDSGPPDLTIGWISIDDGLLGLFRPALREACPTMRLLTVADISPTASDPATQHGLTRVLEEAESLVFDFSENDETGQRRTPGSRSANRACLMTALLRAVRHELARQESGGRPRRFIGVNAIHNVFEGIFTEMVSCARTPFSARLRHGFVPPPDIFRVVDWLPRMRAGDAGRRENGAIVASGRGPGCLAFGPYVYLLPGRYRLDIDLREDDAVLGNRAAPGGATAFAGLAPIEAIATAALRSPVETLRKTVRKALDLSRNARARSEAAVICEVVSGDHVLAVRKDHARRLFGGRRSLPVEIRHDLFADGTRPGVELRITMTWALPLRLNAVTLHDLTTAGARDAAEDRLA